MIFPDASVELVEGLYRGNLGSDYFNRLVAETVVAFLRGHSERLHDAPFRLLEIGAGTGATSEVVFEQLTQARMRVGEYSYTDVSPTLVDRARRSYAKLAPYASYRRVDIEDNLGPQGLRSAPTTC